jgi:cell division protein FtsN
VPRYFEIIITRRQLAGLLGGVVLLVAIAFGLGVTVRWFEPAAPPREYIARSTPPATGDTMTHLLGPAPESSAAPGRESPATPVPPPTFPPAEPTATPTQPPAPPTPGPSPTTAPSRPTPVRVAVAAVDVAAQRWVQIAALSHRRQAEGVRTRVMALGFTRTQVVVEPAPHGKFRVRLGPFPDGESADRVAARLRAQGFPGAFVVRADE